MKTFGLGGLLLALSLFGLAPTEGQVTTYDFEGKEKRGVPAPWVLKKVKGKPSFTVVADPEGPGKKQLRMHSKRSSFSLNRAIGLPIETWRHATWSWKAEKLPHGKKADARQGTKCDQGLQVMFAFDGGDRLISYVWDTNAPVGTRTTESFRIPLIYSKTVKVIVVQSGQEGLGEWSTITRDLLADYRMVYPDKKAPKKVAMVRVQSNSQYTKTEGIAIFGPIELKTSLE